MEYLVDVVVPIYNHERYLRDTFDGFVKQVTDFKFRVLASDDCSTDNTRAIMKEYGDKYPDMIFPIYREKNGGPLANGYSLMARLEAKYIAVCDGDDYWTDPHKLQKQISFLENNPDFSITFGDVDIIDELGLGLPHDRFFPKLDKDVFTIEDFIASEMHIIPTPTLVYRNILPKPFPDFFLRIYNADAFVIMLAADKGKAKYFPEKMGIYRNHSGGMTKSEQMKRDVDYRKYQLYIFLDEYLGFRHHAAFRKKLLEMTKVRMIFGAREMNVWGRLKNVMKNTKDYFKYSDRIDVKEIIYYTCVLFFPSLLKMKKGKN